MLGASTIITRLSYSEYYSPMVNFKLSDYISLGLDYKAHLNQ